MNSLSRRICQLSIQLVKVGKITIQQPMRAVFKTLDFIKLVTTTGNKKINFYEGLITSFCTYHTPNK